jgi:hypothetical protein
MRTPGRCTNTEGCWIGASRRDVWSKVGEEFVCPNCGGALVPPGRKSLSLRGIRQAALLSALLLAVVAAGGFAAVRLSPLAVSAARPILAALWKAPRQLMAAHIFGVPAHSATATRVTPVVAAARVANSEPPAPSMASSPPRQAPMQLAAGTVTFPGDQRVKPRVPGPVVLYSAPFDHPAKPSQVKPVPHAVPPAAEDQPQEPGLPPPEPMSVVTLLSEARLVATPSSQAPVVLPVTFGRPVAPENDAEPVRLHWRYHGLVATAPRRSVFRSEPSDSVEAMCRTLEPLQ